MTGLHKIVTYKNENRRINCLYCGRKATLSDFRLPDDTPVTKAYYCPHCGGHKALHCPPEIPFGPPDQWPNTLRS